MSHKVAHVMRTYGVHGGENQLAQLFRSFNEVGFQHIFFSLYRDDICQRHFSAIPQLDIKTLLGVKAKVFPSLRKEMLWLLLFLPILQIRLLFALRRHHCRICVAHGVQGGMVVWLAAMVLRNVRFVYVHRGTKSSQSKSYLFALLYRPFHVVAGVSQASAASLSDLLPNRKPLPIENGIDWRLVETTLAKCTAYSHEDYFTVICIGRLIPAKGQALIINAFAEIYAELPYAKLLIVGDGPDAESLKIQAQHLGIAECIHFLGERKDIVCLLGNSDVFIHASLSEGLSNAVLEAMAVGLPSIVVAAPGVTECHINKVTGFVVSRAQANLGAYLLTLARDAALRERMGREAKLRVREYYSIDANCKRYANLYRQLLSR